MDDEVNLLDEGAWVLDRNRGYPGGGPGSLFGGNSTAKYELPGASMKLLLALESAITGKFWLETVVSESSEAPIGSFTFDSWIGGAFFLTVVSASS